MFYIGIVILVDYYLRATLPIKEIIGSSIGSIRYSDILILILLFQHRHREKRELQNDAVANRQFIILITILMILFFISSLRANTLSLGLADFRNIMLKPFLSMLLVRNGFKDKNQIEQFILYTVILGLIFTIGSIEMKYFDRLFIKGTHYDSSLMWGALRRSGRVGGFFGNPNNMGNICVLLVPIHFIGIQLFADIKRKLFVIFSLLGIVFAMVLTESRGSYMGAGISIICYLALPVGKLTVKNKVKIVFCFFAIFMALMPGAIQKISDRLAETDSQQEIVINPSQEEAIDGESLDSRLALWKDGITIGKTKPIFGIGLGEDTFRSVSAMMREMGLVQIELDHAHSSYINLFVQTGFISLLAFLGINILVIKTNISAIYKNREQKDSVVIAGCNASIVGFLFCLITQNTLFKIDASTVYWVFLSLSIALSSKMQNESSKREFYDK